MRSDPIDLLIVDDSAAIRKILQRIVCQTDLAIGKILEAADGLQALQVLRQNAVSAVLVDINMPNMNGIQFLQAVRNSDDWKTLPVIMVTTEGSHAAVQQAIESGATGYVRKPFTPDQIRAKLTALFERQS